MNSDTFQKIEQEANQGAFGDNNTPLPTDAMIHAGNYKLGKTSLHGIPVHIENPRGSYRSGQDSKGNKWQTRLAGHYGYFPGTVGNDGDAIDCFIGSTPMIDHAYVINQSFNNRFDEHKAVLACIDEQTARLTYLNSYSPDWKGLHSIVRLSIPQLKWWLKNGNHKRPLLPEHLPNLGNEKMKITWDDTTNLPVGTTPEKILYDIHKDEKDEGLNYDESLLLEPLDIDEIYGDDEVTERETLDAIISPFGQLKRKAQIFERIMQHAGTDVKPVAVQVSDPFKLKGVAQVVVVFELSDGQTVSIYFHNPDVNHKKFTPNDELVSWKWLLNKKDITIVVAPENGKDLNVKLVAARVMKLAQKNTSAFKRANAKRAESLEAIKNLQEAEIPALEKELDETKKELEIAKVHLEDKLLKSSQDKGDLKKDIMFALIDLGWVNTLFDKALTPEPSRIIGGDKVTIMNPNGTRRVVAKIKDNQIVAATGAKVAASVPLDINETAEQNAARLNDAVNAVDPNYKTEEEVVIIEPEKVVEVEETDNRLPDSDFKIDVYSLFDLFPEIKKYGVSSAVIHPDGSVSIESDKDIKLAGVTDDKILDAWRANDLLKYNSEFAREDHLEVNRREFNKFRDVHKFQLPEDIAEGIPYDIENDPLYELEESAFIVDQAVKENNGIIVFGNYDASVHNAALFDSSWSQNEENSRYTDFNPGGALSTEKQLTSNYNDQVIETDIDNPDESDADPDVVPEEKEHEALDGETNSSPINGVAVGDYPNVGQDIKKNLSYQPNRIVDEGQGVDFDSWEGGLEPTISPTMTDYNQNPKETEPENVALDSETIKPINPGAKLIPQANSEVYQTITTIAKPVAAKVEQNPVDPMFGGGIDIPANDPEPFNPGAKLDGSDTSIDNDGIIVFKNRLQKQERLLLPGGDKVVAIKDNKVINEIDFSVFKTVLGVDNSMTMEQAIAAKNLDNANKGVPITFVDKKTLDSVKPVLDDVVIPGSVIGQIASTGADLLAKDLKDVEAIKKAVAEAFVESEVRTTTVPEPELQPQPEPTPQPEINPMAEHIQFLQDVVDGKFDNADMIELINKIELAGDTFEAAGLSEQYNELLGKAVDKYMELDLAQNG